MSKRAIAIPTLQALALVTTQTACGDLMLGTWDGSRLEENGYSIDLPLINESGNYYYYSYYGDVFAFRSTLETKLTLDRFREGEFTIIRTYDYGQYQRNDMVYDLVGERLSPGVWNLSIPDFLDLELSCVATDETLECEGERSDIPVAYDFKRGDAEDETEE